MAAPSSVKTQSSELVALAETLDLTQYQPLYDFLQSKLADLHLNHASVADQLSQETQDEVLVNIDLAKTWQIKLLERINSFSPYCRGKGKFHYPHSRAIFSKLKNEDKDLFSFRNCKK